MSAPRRGPLTLESFSSSSSIDRPARMNPEIKTQWVAALRSGQYAQGEGCLRTDEGKYCCLGVLQHIYRADESEFDNSVIWTRAFPEASVQGWSGLTSQVVIDFLARSNDNGFTFEQIADWIEAYL